MLDQFTHWWGVKDTLPLYTDAIALVSFGATETRMTYGSVQVMAVGCDLKKHYPASRIIFGEFTENKIQGLEHQIKMFRFPGAIYSGEVISTIEEAEKWKDSLKHITVNRVIIVTDEMHSRSARRVSNRVWNGVWYKRLWKWTTLKPVVQIHTVTFRTWLAIDPESPITALRSKWLWIHNNVLRELFLMFVPFGYTIMKKLNIHQPTTK